MQLNMFGERERERERERGYKFGCINWRWGMGNSMHIGEEREGWAVYNRHTHGFRRNPK